MLAGFVTRMKAAIAAFRNPNSFPGETVTDLTASINLLWSYYSNSVFDDINAWAKYRENFTLYRNIRSIYNPTRRIVNFYVAQVYPGVLSEDADSLPDGVQLAIPLSADTDDSLKDAIAQFWQWSNWQSGNRLMVRYGGATGSCLVEVVDAVDRGKVSASVRWPGWVDADSLVLDGSGNVKAYALEYQVEDKEASDTRDRVYTYRKEVDGDSFRFYKNDQPFDYGQGAEFDNPYGFVPAVWCKHLDEGNDFGSPAIAGSIAKFDELNGLASHVHDQVDILIDSPGIIASEGVWGKAGQQAKDHKASVADEYAAATAVKEKPTNRLLLKGPYDTRWVPLTGNLQPEQVAPSIDRLLSEIEHDFPELSTYTELRKMSQVTGPGAARMMGDVYSRVLEVASNYDQQSIKLFQMAVAIGGMRYAEGQQGWSMRTDQQRKFALFNLESYRRGDLDFAIMPRPLIPMTEQDVIQLTGQRLENAKKAKDVFSQERVLEIAGIADEDERRKELGLLEAEHQQSVKERTEMFKVQKPPNGDSELVQ